MTQHPARLPRDIDPQSGAAGPNASTAEACDLLMAPLLALIAPLLRVDGLGDIAPARHAARRTLAAYRAEHPDDLIAAARIVGFALVALDSLRLSVQADLSPTIKLRLRGNANALNRASRGAGRALQRSKRAVPGSKRGDPGHPAPVAGVRVRPEQAHGNITHAHGDADPAAIAAPAAGGCIGPHPPADRRADDHHKRLWADAMRDVALECSDGLSTLPAALRPAELMRIEVLTEAARTLQADGPAARQTVAHRSHLLQTTTLAGHPGQRDPRPSSGEPADGRS